MVAVCDCSKGGHTGASRCILRVWFDSEEVGGHCMVSASMRVSLVLVVMVFCSLGNCKMRWEARLWASFSNADLKRLGDSEGENEGKVALGIGSVARIDTIESVKCGISLNSAFFRDSAELGETSLATTRPFTVRQRRMDVCSVRRMAATSRAMAAAASR